MRRRLLLGLLVGYALAVLVRRLLAEPPTPEEWLALWLVCTGVGVSVAFYPDE